MGRCTGWPGYDDMDKGGPYTFDEDFTPGTASKGKEFTDKQRALLMAYNIHRNDGRLTSDYFGLDEEVLPAPYKETIEYLKVPVGLETMVKEYYMQLYETAIEFETAGSEENDSAAVDHIVSKTTASGSNLFNNAAVISRKCNSSKGTTYIETLVDHYATCED